jgi:pyroglutamyl-peptidase
VLLTGFEPFGKYKTNPSWNVINDLNNIRLAKFTLKTARLSVSFRKVPSQLHKLIKRHNPKIVISLGMYKGEKIRLEKMAMNIMHSYEPDNDGISPQHTPIRPRERVVLASRLNLSLIEKKLKESDIPVCVSYQVKQAHMYATSSSTFCYLQE